VVEYYFYSPFSLLLYIAYPLADAIQALFAYVVPIGGPALAEGVDPFAQLALVMEFMWSKSKECASKSVFGCVCECVCLCECVYLCEIVCVCVYACVFHSCTREYSYPIRPKVVMTKDASFRIAISALVEVTHT